MCSQLYIDSYRRMHTYMYIELRSLLDAQTHPTTPLCGQKFESIYVVQVYIRRL